MNEEFVRRYLEVFKNTHAMSASAIAVLCVAAREPCFAIKPPMVVQQLGLSYQTALNLVQRLKVEGYLNKVGFLTNLGRKAVGLPPLPGSVTNV